MILQTSKVLFFSYFEFFFQFFVIFLFKLRAVDWLLSVRHSVIHSQWRRHGGQTGAVPPTLSGVDFEISADPVRKLVR